MSPMQKWEYCELEVSIGGPLSGTRGHFWQFKPEGMHAEREGKYGQLMAELGREGWELVVASARIATGLGGKHVINYVFKRPVQEGAG